MSQPPSGQDPYGPGGSGQPPGQGGWGQPQGQGGWGQPEGGTPGGQPPQPGQYGQPGQPPQYGQPAQPGQTGQYGQPGSYGQPGQYGQPGPYGQPGQGPAKNRRGLIIGLVAGLVALVAVAVVLVLTLGGDDDPTPAASSTSSSTSSSSSTSPSATSSSRATSSSSSSAPAPAPAGGDLLSILPTDFTDCQEAPVAGDGDVAHAECGPATTQPGPSQAQFYLYPDRATLDEVFTGEVAGTGLSDVPPGQDCSTATGVGEWGAGENSGLVACGIDPSGQVIIFWTDNAALVEGFVSAPGDTQADLAALYDWWINHSNYQV